jgi:predicted MPP superfamily phosphohydrolase
MILNYRIKKRLIIALIIIVLLIVFCIWQNNSIVISQFTYVSDKVPNAFDNFKILHISDLHNKSFGHKQSYLIKKVKETSPDIIVITGDLVDRGHYNLETAINFVQQAVNMAPVYYVSGNHEAWTGKYEEIKSRLQDAGAIVLNNEALTCWRDGSSIRIIGLMDPQFMPSDYLDGLDTRQMEGCYRILVRLARPPASESPG